MNSENSRIDESIDRNFKMIINEIQNMESQLKTAFIKSRNITLILLLIALSCFASVFYSMLKHPTHQAQLIIVVQSPSTKT